MTIEELNGKLFHYRAKCIEVIDGDTIHIDWDLGKRIHDTDAIIRFSRINTPERFQKGYDEAKAYVRTRIDGKKIFIITEKDLRDDADKTGGFGRYLAEIFYETQVGLWVNLNDELLERGLAKVYIKR